MLIKNKSKKTIIAKDAKACKSILCKTIGLMFSKIKPLIFIFKKEIRITLHMFFVFKPIDLIFLNKNKIVTETKHNFKPFTIYTPKEKVQYIIELPKSSIQNSKTEKADVVELLE